MWHEKIRSKSVYQMMRPFANDQRGNVALMFCICAVPLVGAVGLSIDYSTARRHQTGLQSALDAAVLAGAIAQSQGTGDAAAVVSNYMAIKFNDLVTTVSVNTTVDKQGGVAASATSDIPTAFGALFGMPTFTVRANAQAGFSSSTLEAAIVFDTTGSMAGTKLSSAQQAASSLVDPLYAMPGASTKVRTALVPFSYYVNVGTTYRGASWLSNTSDSSTSSYQCWNTYPNATYGSKTTTTGTCYSDGVAYSCSSTSAPVTNYGPAVQQCGQTKSTYTWYGCVGSRNYPLNMQDTVNSTDPIPGILNQGCSAPLVRLTNDSAAVKKQIMSMSASGEIYIAPGLLWGWRSLSPNAPFADGAVYSPATRKVIVLMTDGANTHSPNYPDHEGTNTDAANKLTAELCSSIKKTGIDIYTIAFDVSDVTIKSILQSCATSPSFYYDATTVSSMQEAFGQIATALAGVRLVQ